MARCTHCGKVNRDDSLFCQECGQRLEAPKPAPAPTPTLVNCSSCGAANVEGMNFCKMCGTPLNRSAHRRPAAAAPAPTPAPAPPSDKQSCSACGKLTPAGFSFCQHCGRRFNSTEARNLGVASTMAADVGMPAPTPPAGMPAAKPTPAAAPSPSRDDAWASTMAANTPSPVAVAPAPAPVAQPYASAPSAPSPVVAAPAYRAVPASSPVQANPAIAAPAPAPLPANGRNVNSAATARAIAEPPVVGRLVPLNRDGSAGRALPLPVGSFDVGRTEGDLSFGEDLFLADPHARLVCESGGIVCQPIDRVNGVFLRLRGRHVLSDGDTLLVGRQLLRFDVIGAAESQPPMVTQHGVRRFGSADRATWGRLRQLTIAGTTADVWHLTRDEMILGREEGDFTFSDDEFMSRRHALFRHDGASLTLEDLGSSNGTFVRLRGPQPIVVGDVLRMGDQLMRLES